VLCRRPRSSAAWRQAGDGYFLLYRKTGDRAELTKAVEHYRRAVELYPNHPLGHAHLAVSLRAAGEINDAGNEAGKALELHRLTPHADQKLPSGLVQQLEEFSL